MKPNSDNRRAWSFLLLGAVVVVVLMAVGCFGGGDETSSNGVTTVSDSSGTVSSAPGVTTTVVAAIDPLSSFKSKDPFVPQAQLTTTSAAPTTVYTTTTSSTTTTVFVTTTITHRLRVTDFSSSPEWVSFTIDSIPFTEVTPSDGLFIGPWGIVQLVDIDTSGAAPFAVFSVAYSTNLTLYLDQTGTWSTR